MSHRKDQNGVSPLHTHAAPEMSTEDGHVLSDEELKAQWQAATARRVNDCRRMLLAVLQEYGCDMIPVVTIKGQQIIASIDIVPKET